MGGGITGSFLAEQLSRITKSIVIIDRHVPHTASTAASTSLVQWELDTPFGELSRRLDMSDDEFGFRAAAGLYSEGAAEANPVLLARGLLACARSRGVQSFYPETAVAYDIGRSTTTILTASGHEVCTDFLVLANGYEMPDFVPSKIHSIISTWALATSGQVRRWPKRALVWEASSPYLYARQTSDGRVIIGGEDEQLTALRDRIFLGRLLRRYTGRAAADWPFASSSPGSLQHLAMAEMESASARLLQK